MGISDNIAAVKANIRESAAKAGRAPEDITLAAVTKFQTAERVNEAIAAGVRVIAENRAQAPTVAAARPPFIPPISLCIMS